MNQKFSNKEYTLKGEPRAYVELESLETLWFNTGSQCNLTCANCYIESSPKNDRLSYLLHSDLVQFLNEIKDLEIKTKNINFTGGEPFINPHIISLLEESLTRGFQVLVLTNAYRVTTRYLEELKELTRKHPGRLQLRISLDHYTKEGHESQRGDKTFELTLNAISQLIDNSIDISIAGRSINQESLSDAWNSYQHLFDSKGISLKLTSDNFVLFPEMNSTRDVPEISVNCWEILKKTPSQQMCSKERMIVKNKEHQSLQVMPCTLLAYDQQFNLGQNLKTSENKVYLNHRFCAEFCVLGGASCSKN